MWDSLLVENIISKTLTEKDSGKASDNKKIPSIEIKEHILRVISNIKRKDSMIVKRERFCECYSAHAASHSNVHSKVLFFPQ